MVCLEACLREGKLKWKKIGMVQSDVYCLACSNDDVEKWVEMTRVSVSSGNAAEGSNGHADFFFFPVSCLYLISNDSTRTQVPPQDQHR